MEDPEVYSDRVCNPCGRKILNLCHLFELIKAGTSPTLSNTSIKITKRTLSTPEKASPSWRKAKLVRVNSPEASTPRQMKSSYKSRKSLSFTGANCTTRIPSQKEDEVLRRLNVDDLPSTGLQVKVVYVNPFGKCDGENPATRPNQNIGEKPRMQKLAGSVQCCPEARRTST